MGDAYTFDYATIGACVTFATREIPSPDIGSGLCARLTVVAPNENARLDCVNASTGKSVPFPPGAVLVCNRSPTTAVARVDGAFYVAPTNTYVLLLDGAPFLTLTASHAHRVRLQ